METAELFKKEAQELLLPAKFGLRGWEFGLSAEKKIVSVLGMLWNTREDCLKIDLENLKKRVDGPATKRMLLSMANMVFDPLELVCPVTLRSKILMKKACNNEMKLGWDDSLPDEIAKEFEKWKVDVLNLEGLKIPRWLTGHLIDRSFWSLHVFCDASTSAYATSIFLRVVGKEVTVQLVQAKSRITPKKCISMPRLELLSCCIGARLAKTVKDHLMCEDIRTYFWSDSTVALAWIQNDGTWGTFVANRLKEIRQLTDISCSAKQLITDQWWEGPNWLKEEEREWPWSVAQPDPQRVNLERKKTVVSAINNSIGPCVVDDMLKYSDYHKMLRITALVVRYLEILKTKPAIRIAKSNMKNFKELTFEEIEKAEKTIFRHIQKKHFSGLDDSRIKKLRPFKDDQGLLCIKTKLIFGMDEDNFQCPIVLPDNSDIVKLMILKEHQTSSHAGVQVLQSMLRERLWILNSRRTIGNVIRKCATCRRFNATRCEIEEAPLPVNRIKNAKAFEVTGVDLAGPLILRGGQKIWIVLYTCAVYRAVHLELACSLSTNDFIKTLRMFIARRGRLSIIYSDNGLNFVGYNNAFKKIDWKQVHRYSTVNRIDWRFNPPSAAWWGGFWERLVGLVKRLLRRILGNASVTYEELQTLLCEVESSLNERPLTYVSEDSSDLQPLTPSMFLRENASCSFPEAEVMDATTLNKNLRKCQRLRVALRSRFKKEYLGQLVYTGKMKNTPQISPRDVVLSEIEDKKRIDWPMGILDRLYPLEVKNRLVNQFPKTVDNEVKDRAFRKSETINACEDSDASDEQYFESKVSETKVDEKVVVSDEQCVNNSVNNLEDSKETANSVVIRNRANTVLSNVNLNCV
ncbi:hypothetical protein ILUMI_26644 [Ignelater luminosus]|uniref:Integrase catalytic domain-containing protein n=1 Tax=Ignelater luminosus TaxID=2038154 RepID=A0A8K0C5I4_IGNLU|nr:hypothetical protein ILUMI_26644 [Ignelater luminosus]